MFLFVFYSSLLKVIKFWTHEIPTRKNFWPTKFSWEKKFQPKKHSQQKKIRTHEIPTRKNFGLTMARWHEIHETHNVTSPQKFSLLIIYNLGQSIVDKSMKLSNKDFSVIFFHNWLFVTLLQSCQNLSFGWLPECFSINSKYFTTSSSEQFLKSNSGTAWFSRKFLLDLIRQL